jgi:HIT domain
MVVLSGFDGCRDNTQSTREAPPSSGIQAALNFQNLADLTLFDTGELREIRRRRMFPSKPFDVGAYEKRSKEGPCFICELVAGSNPHHVIYEDQTAVVFLNKYPVLYGHTLVAPRDHCEQATGHTSS